MTAPRHNTVSTLPACAKARATRGSSNAPGAQATVTSRRSDPASSSAPSAPSSKRSVMPPLNSAQAMPMRSPVPSAEACRLAPTRMATSSSAPVGSATRSASAISVEGSSQDVVEPVQQVAHALALRTEVGDVLRVGGGLQLDALGDVEAEALEPAVLHGIVRHQAHGRDAEVDQHLGTDAVLAAVDREALLQVGVNGVMPFLLQLIGADFVAEADAAALVAPQVDEDAASLLLNEIERGLQLGAAVAAQGAEDVAGQALGVDPDEHVVGAGHLAHGGRLVLLVVQHRLVDVGPNPPFLGRDAGLGDEANELLVLAAVADE